MNTLEQLLNGDLKGESRISLSCELKIFPREILELADTLEILDLRDNELDSLPDDFHRLKKLRILFLSENNFREFPAILGKCNALTMIGFKSNQIAHIPDNAFPLNTQWLILTDNKIEKIPDSIGDLKRLQKCLLAGNRIKTLPEHMSSCKNLKLLRISANALERLPNWLFSLPKLAWLACAGNPCTTVVSDEKEGLENIHWDKLTLHEQLGEGASGLISKGYWECITSDIAIKVFKGEVTSDGYPEDEMRACIAAGHHENLPKIHGKLHAHPEKKEGLVLSLIPESYVNLGNPPTLTSCTRDTYDKDTLFSMIQIRQILADITSAILHLHSKKIMHGDLYAHNILINNKGESLLSDFGAATLYDGVRRSVDKKAFQRLEARAFGCLIEDLIIHAIPTEKQMYMAAIEKLKSIKDRCMDENVAQRPLFVEIEQLLSQIE